MNSKTIVYLLGKILGVEAILLVLPAVIAVYYQEGWQQVASYLIVASVLGVFSLITSRYCKTDDKIYTREGMVIVALSWLLLSLFGAIPLYLTGEIPQLADGFFEISSGFTTTGSTVLTSLSGLQHSSLFWRSFTHFIGGMGFLVFTIAILPNAAEYVQLMRAEVPGPVFGKIVAKLSGTARILYGIYFCLTIGLILVLWWLKVPLFDAVLLGMGTAGTGGFSIHDAGFSIYEHQKAVEWVLGVGMLIFGVNFNLYYLMLLGYIKETFRRDTELKVYLSIITLATVVICMNLFSQVSVVTMDVVRNVFFTVVSIITTTGYVSVDFEQWPLFSQMVLLLLMFIGGCAGSTAGGIKVSRIVMYVKMLVAQVKESAQVGRVVVPTLSGKPIDRTTQKQVANYLLVYLLIFIGLVLCVSFEAGDFMTAFSTVATTFNNIGPGFAQVGPVENFAMYSPLMKVILSFGMIAGRLEIYPMLILFSSIGMRKDKTLII